MQDPVNEYEDLKIKNHTNKSIYNTIMVIKNFNNWTMGVCVSRLWNEI